MEKTWVYGGLRVADGQAVTCTAASRNSVNYQRFLELVEAANQAGDILVITDNLSSHTSVATRTWLADHPRIRQVFIPKGACWLNLQEAWWRLFRRAALAEPDASVLGRGDAPGIEFVATGEVQILHIFAGCPGADLLELFARYVWKV